MPRLEEMTLTEQVVARELARWHLAHFDNGTWTTSEIDTLADTRIIHDTDYLRGARAIISVLKSGSF